MNPFILSTEQLSIVNTTKTLVNVTYKNSDKVCQTFLMRAIRNFSDQKSTLLIVPDRKFEQRICSLLKILALENVSLSVSIENSVTEKDLNVLRERCTLISKNENNPVKNNPLVNILNDKTASYYHDSRFTKIWKNKTWRELLDDYLIKVQNEDSDVLKSLLDELIPDFTESEFDNIYQNITDAVFIYQRDFELNDFNTTTNHLSADKNPEDNFQNITYELFKLKEQAQNLCERYGNVISRIDRLFTKTSHQYVSDTLDQIKILIHRTDTLIQSGETLSGYFSSLSAIAKERTKSIKKLIDDTNFLAEQLTDKKILLSQNKIKDIAEVHGILALLTKAVKDWKTKIPELKLAFLRSVNKLNYHDPLLEDIERDATYLVGKINESVIFSRIFELNTLSFKKQHEYIVTLIYELEVMMLNISKNIPYYQWVTFLNELDEKSRKIIRTLKIFDPSEWLLLFDVWYHYRLLEHYGNFDDINDDVFENFLHHETVSEKEKILHSLNLHTKTIETVIKSLKNENPELYNVLIKKKNTSHPELWKHFFTENAAVLRKLYPIFIINADDINELNTAIFDELICIDVKNINPEILQKFKSIISFYQQDEQITNPDFRLTGEENISFTPMQEIHTTGRISLVRNITHELLQFGHPPSVYRIKNAAIVSFGTDYTNDCLTDYFYKHGIKKLDGDQSIEEIIIGSLLDADMVAYILIEDYLINPTSTFSDILCQRQAIKNLTDAGCIILNLDSTLLFETKGLNMHELFIQIKSEQLSENFSKKQLSIEFH